MPCNYGLCGLIQSSAESLNGTEGRNLLLDINQLVNYTLS